MTSPAFSPIEAAERLGVSPSTIKNWAVRLPVPSWVGDDGTRRFPPEALEVFETVKRMRADERSYATIRRVIEPLELEDGAPDAAPAPLAPRADLPQDRITETMAIVRPLWNALQTEQATSARRIARLEAKVDQLRADRVAILAELDALQQALGNAPAGLRARKPWWRRLLGR